MIRLLLTLLSAAGLSIPSLTMERSSQWVEFAVIAEYGPECRVYASAIVDRANSMEYRIAPIEKDDMEFRLGCRLLIPG